MGKFLEILDDNKELFEQYKGSLREYEFPRDMTDLVIGWFYKINPRYEVHCLQNGVDPQRIRNISLKLDNFGKAYIEFLGNDGVTKILLVRNKFERGELTDIVGKKVEEDAFFNMLDRYQNIY